MIGENVDEVAVVLDVIGISPLDVVIEGRRVELELVRAVGVEVIVVTIVKVDAKTEPSVVTVVVNVPVEVYTPRFEPPLPDPLPSPAVFVEAGFEKPEVELMDARDKLLSDATETLETDASDVHSSAVRSQYVGSGSGVSVRMPIVAPKVRLSNKLFVAS